MENVHFQKIALTSPYKIYLSRFSSNLSNMQMFKQEIKRYAYMTLSCLNNRIYVVHFLNKLN